jgi:hypothetical protein
MFLRPYNNGIYEELNIAHYSAVYTTTNMDYVYKRSFPRCIYRKRNIKSKPV